MSELLPCPFCGEAAFVGGYSYDEPSMFYVSCSSPDCYCCLGEGYDRDAMPDHSFGSEEAAIAAWNNRTDLSKLNTTGEVKG